MMKRLMIMLLSFGFAFTIQAQIGKRFPSEKQVYVDSQTGALITVLTSSERSDKALYQTDPMWTADGRYILFRSSTRYDATPKKQQIYFMDEASGEIIQATEGEGMDGVYLAHHSNKMFFFRRSGEEKTMYELNLDSLFADSKRGTMKVAEAYERKIGLFPKQMGRAGGFAVDCDDTYAYITVGREETTADRKKAKHNKAANWRPADNQPVKVAHSLSGIRKMNLQTGEVSMVLDADFRIGHIQTSLFTPGEIVYCHETGGDAPQRMWFCTADGKINKPLYAETPLDWVTHETFSTKDYVYFCILGFQERLRKQANGIMRINLRTDDVELMGQVEMDKDRRAIEGQLTGRGFWHCNSSRDGKWSVGDTFGGNIWLIDNETGEKRMLVSDTKMRPDHAHPYFSPDGKRILFQSGHLSNGERLQLMMVNVP